MTFERPDLSAAPPEIRRYIENLEAEIERLRSTGKRPAAAPRSKPVKHIARAKAKVTAEATVEEPFEPLPEISEPAEDPTTINIITATIAGNAKRTPRHLYERQRRGGMGVFDIDTPQNEPPVALSIADESQSLLFFTNLGRAFRLPVSLIPETPVRAHGEFLFKKLPLLADEHLAIILPEQAQGYVALVSQNGMVRLLRHHVFGEYMKPGASLYDFRTFGPLAAACWTPGDGDLFIASRQGRAIRFAEKLVPPQGGLGVRLPANDVAVGITAVYPDSGVFLLSADGRGTIRQMEGFAPNKAPGAGGKIAINTENLVCALNTDEQQDVFIISKLSKIIRFRISDIPAKDGVVQGVVCMSLRADEPVAVVLNPIRNP